MIFYSGHFKIFMQRFACWSTKGSPGWGFSSKLTELGSSNKSSFPNVTRFMRNGGELEFLLFRIFCCSKTLSPSNIHRNRGFLTSSVCQVLFSCCNAIFLSIQVVTSELLCKIPFPRKRNLVLDQTKSTSRRVLFLCTYWGLKSSIFEAFSF